MPSRRILLFIALSLGLVGISACGTDSSEASPAYVQTIEAWRQERIDALMAPDGWPALAGLFWLEPGANTFGAHPDNSVVFPDKVPDTLGMFRLENDSVFMEMAPGQKATVEGREVAGFSLSGYETPPMVHFGDLSWIMIQRTDKLGIRLWDRKHSNLEDTIHIESFPIDPDWRIAAQWIPDTTGQKVHIRNVLDMEMDLETAGRLRFEYQGETHELTALEGSETTFFLIFADATSGSETYSGGRYLYADRPDSDGLTYLDFNKAYNPPCAFTEFATCLLPPVENRLEFPIMAGELTYSEH